MYMYSNHLLTAAISNQTIMENGHEHNHNVTPSDRNFFTRVELKNLVRPQALDVWTDFFILSLSFFSFSPVL